MICWKCGFYFDFEMGDTCPHCGADLVEPEDVDKDEFDDGDEEDDFDKEPEDEYL